ncbi:MAG: phosphoadenylyl-sulfate reductase, partial [Mariprofundales bacterium]
MLNDKIKNSLALVRQAIAKHARFCCYPTSLGAEASVLIDLICRNNLDIAIITLDTGKLPPETLDLIVKIKKHYQIDIAIITPDLSDVQQLIAEYGDDLYRKSIELRKACCHVRKVEPLTKTLVGKAWITGRRREQSKDRQKLAFIEKSPSIGIEKYNPLLAWTYKEIWEYIRMFDVPYNALFDCHYRSIGCYPCTRAIAVGEDERAGRWWWELDDAASECGLHMSPINQNNKVKSLKNNPWKGKRILITGVCGTVGKELLRQVVKQEPY